MAELLEFTHYVPTEGLSSFVKALIEDTVVGPKFEDFSYDPNGVPVATVSARVDNLGDSEALDWSIRRCAYDALKFNITG